MAPMSDNMTQRPQKQGALSLIKSIFEKNKARLTERDGHFDFGFSYAKDRSENMVVEADDEHVNVRVIDPCWHEVSKWDIEEVTRIQSMVNVCNSYSRCKVIYHFTDDDTMQLSTIAVFPMYEDIPDIEDYFSAQLNEMIQTHEFILHEEGAEETASEETENRNDNPTAKEEGGQA